MKTDTYVSIINEIELHIFQQQQQQKKLCIYT